jgi:hypothetical protein
MSHDPTIGAYSRRITRGVEAQLDYRDRLQADARRGARDAKLEQARAVEDVRTAVARGLLPRPGWLVALDRGHGQAPPRPEHGQKKGQRQNPKPARKSATKPPTTPHKATADAGLAAQVARLKQAWGC